MFDILQYTKELEASGWTEAQANALIKVVSSIMDKNFSTKSDFEKMRLWVQHELEKVRMEMNAGLKAVKTDLRQDFNAKFKTVDREFAQVHQEISDLRKDMLALGDKIVIKLSGVMFVLAGFLYTLQKFG